jgi:murein L,D-transpeptidase YafK
MARCLAYAVVPLLVLAVSLFSPGITDATAVKADRVVVFKGKRVMALLREGEIIKTYRIALGKQPSGHKMQAGDNRTPEGVYILDSRNQDSKYHLSLHISYPNEADIERARAFNLPAGGDIMIHGVTNGNDTMGKFHKYTDWTNGCIAVTNTEIEEIWNLVPDGTPIEINP